MGLDTLGAAVKPNALRLAAYAVLAAQSIYFAMRDATSWRGLMIFNALLFTTVTLIELTMLTRAWWRRR